MYISAALTPAILWLGLRWPIERRGWPRRVSLHVLFSILFAVVELALEAIVFARFGLLASALTSSFWVAFPALIVAGFHGNVITYWVILGSSRAGDTIGSTRIGSCGRRNWRAR